jgi:hypothetical protein
MHYEGPTFIIRLLALLPRSIRKKGLRLARKHAPYTRWGDRLIFDVNFLTTHGRLPSRKNLFNDRLYQLYTSDGILAPERQFSCDKYLGKIYAKAILDRDISVPTLGIIETPDELRRFNFPANCVIKATHSAGRGVIRRDGADLDLDEIEKWLSSSFYRENREANYRYLRPRIIVEPVVFAGEPVDDFKVFCYNGKACCILYVADRNIDLARVIMYPDWTPLPVYLAPKTPDPLPSKPATLHDMLVAAEKLAQLFDIVRVDFFSSGNRLYLGEISHVHMCGLEKFRNDEEEEILSRVIFGEK